MLFETLKSCCKVQGISLPISSVILAYEFGQLRLHHPKESEASRDCLLGTVRYNTVEKAQDFDGQLAKGVPLM